MDGIKASEQNQESETPRILEAREENQPQQAGRSAAKSASRGVTKISPMMGSLLIGTAALLDGAQFIIESVAGLTAILLPLGIAGAWVIDIVAWLTFFLWLHSLGLGMIKKGAAGLGLAQEPFLIIALAFGIEFMPFINALPAWTAAIVVVVLRERVLALAAPIGPGAVSEKLKKATETQ